MLLTLETFIDIGNLEDFPRFVFIDEEFENLIIVNDGGELPGNIN